MNKKTEKEKRTDTMSSNTINIVDKQTDKRLEERRIARVRRSLTMLARSISPNTRYQAIALLESGTLLQQEAFVRAHYRRIMILLVAVGIAWAAWNGYRYFVPAPAPVPLPPPVVQSAGVVQSVQMQNGGFLTSTKSTVTTTIGVIQVVGGVSATKGDVAEINRPLNHDGTPSTWPQPKLCIKSAIKSDCYPIL